MANHQDSRIRVCTTLIPALKAPPHARPGQHPGFGIDRCALQGRRNPPPLQGGTWTRTRPRGVAPGWHAPRRWRVIVAAFSNGENFYEGIYVMASTDFKPSTATPDRVAIRD